MSDIFYVKNNAGQLVAARFLSYNGSYVKDPNASTAESTPIYDQDGNLIQNANADGYLIVPAEYSVDGALAFADKVSSVLNSSSGGTVSGGGAPAALGLMTGAFVPNGSQDLQRSYSGSSGNNPGDFVSGFTDAASFNLGLIATYSGIGEQAAALGGGALNEFHSIFNTLYNELISPITGKGMTSIDTSGLDGNTPANTRSIDAGASFATQLLNSSAPSGSNPGAALGSAQIAGSTTAASVAAALADDAYPLPGSSSTDPAAADRTALTNVLERQLAGLSGTFNISQGDNGSFIVEGDDGATITINSDFSGTQSVPTGMLGGFIQTDFDSSGHVESVLTSSVSTTSGTSGGSTETVTDTLDDGSGNLEYDTTNTLEYNSGGTLTGETLADSNGYQSVYALNIDSSSTVTFYNPSSQKVAQSIFNSSDQQTDYITYDPSTGKITQDQQFTDGQVTDAINYTNGVVTDIVSYNSDEQETSDAIYDASGQEVQQNTYAPGSNTPSSSVYYDPSNGKETSASAFDGQGHLESTTEYNETTGYRTTENIYNTAGQNTNRYLFNATGVQTDDIAFDSATGNEVSDTQYSTSTGYRTVEFDYDPANSKETNVLTFDGQGNLATDTQYSESSGYRTQEDIYNDSGQNTNRYLFNSAGVETDNIGFDLTTGGEISDTEYNTTTGYRTNEALYDASNGDQTNELTFDAQGNLATDTVYSETTGYRTQEDFYNSSGQDLSRYLFNSSGIETDDIAFDANTGKETSDTQYSVATGYRVAEYDFDPSSGKEANALTFDDQGNLATDTAYSESTGYRTQEDLYNASGQDTNRYLFNSTGVETDDIAFDLTSGHEISDTQYNTSTGYRTDEADFDPSTGTQTNELTFDSLGNLATNTAYDESTGYRENESIYNAQQQLIETITFDTGTGIETSQVQYDPSTGNETQADYFNANGQNTGRVLYDSNGDVENITFSTSNGEAISDTVSNPTSGNLYENFYNADGDNTSRLLYDPAGISITNQILFDPTTGRATEFDWLSTTGAVYESDLFNANGDETDQVTYSNGVLSEDAKFNPAAAYSYENLYFNNSGQETEADQFDQTTGDLTQVDWFTGSDPYAWEVEKAVPGGAYIGEVDYFNSTTGAEEGYATYNPVNGVLQTVDQVGGGGLVFAQYSNGDGSYISDGFDDESGSDWVSDDWGDPIVFNLQGQQVQTVGLADSPASFDRFDTGHATPTGWVTPGEGLLVYDPQNTGNVTNESSLVGGFAELDALARQVDGSSGDTLDATDPLWKDLKIWVDPTGTGVFQPSQLVTLTQLGITSIDLDVSSSDQLDHGNRFSDTSTYTKADGTSGQVAGVDFASQAGTAMGTSPSVGHLVASMAAFSANAGASASAGALVRTSDDAVHSPLLIAH